MVSVFDKVAINKIDVQTSSTTSGKYIAELNESQAKSIDKILVQCEVAPVLKIIIATIAIKTNTTVRHPCPLF